MFKSRRIVQAVLLLTMLLGFTGCRGLLFEAPEIPPQEPRHYNAEYNRVWSIARDILDITGYEILQMDRADGYISTAYKENGGVRYKFRIKILREKEGVLVSVFCFAQGKTQTDRKHWSDGGRAAWKEKEFFKSLEENLK